METASVLLNDLTPGISPDSLTIYRINSFRKILAFSSVFCDLSLILYLMWKREGTGCSEDALEVVLQYSPNLLC
jgi:hypothetical protein